MSNWKEREATRFRSGEYKPVPWTAEGWWYTALADGGIAEFHYLHVSRHDSSLVAFTPDAIKGEADRQVRTRPGRYLAKFFPHLSPDTIREWSGKYAAENETPTVQFACSEDEIQEVYENGPNSCMSKAASSYISPVHPVRVYAAGDLSVAYLKESDRITARCIVWQDKKRHQRIYGDVPRLTSALVALGYCWGSLEEARLLKIPAGDGYVVPYVDGAGAADICEDCLIIRSGGEISLAETDGVSLPGEPCDNCGARGEVDFYPGTEESLCESCSEDLTRCEDCNEYTREYSCIGDCTVCNDCLRSNYTLCESCEEWTPDSDVTQVDDKNICNGCLNAIYTKCADCAEYKHEENMHAADGNSVCEACITARYTYCEECGEHKEGGECGEHAEETE